MPIPIFKFNTLTLNIATKGSASLVRGPSRNSIEVNVEIVRFYYLVISETGACEHYDKKSRVYGSFLHPVTCQVLPKTELFKHSPIASRNLLSSKDFNQVCVDLVKIIILLHFI